MEESVLKAEKRDVIGKKAKRLRREGKMPAIIYGQGINPVAISMDAIEASKLLVGFSRSQLLVIDVNGEKHTVLVRAKQYDPLTENMLHVDFLEVSMTETLRTVVPIEIIGEAPAVDAHGALIVTGQEELSIECLPGDLPEVITVDISGLMEIGDAIYVRDANVPPKVDVLTDPDELIVQASMPEAVVEEEEEEEELLEEELEGVEPEVIERGKREEEEEEA
jgi:large subunit ribosomal protein L25